MKKTIIILVVVIVLIFSVVAFYYIKKELNYPPKTKISDCCKDKNIVCNKPGDQPTCMEISFATGEKYPEPKCVCLNPNMDY
ncbi:hypothetical protein KJ840_04215 [Patescibacteria group bacterium]|nr:hypothetical protein [Patescibacteria group bacterium]